VEISSYFGCDRDLNVTVTSKRNFVTDDLTVIEPYKNSTLKSVYFVDKSDILVKIITLLILFHLPTITISEFEFIGNTKLKFKFSGQVLKET
jgi:hypothetical protein